MKPVHLLVELDKAGAEWVVVAYLCGDARMIDICERGVSPHPITGALITGLTPQQVERESKIVGLRNDPLEIEELRRTKIPEVYKADFLPRTMSIRQCGKKANHGLNYDESASQFALIYELEEAEAKRVVAGYHAVYPNIRIWHQAVQGQLKRDRTLTNCFGCKRRFLDRWERDLFKAAYAYLPQSTVAYLTEDAQVKAFDDKKLMASWDLMNNGHDSLTFQALITDWKLFASQCITVGLKYMNPLMEYGGREFRIGTEMKIGRSWGQMREVKLTKDVDKVASDLKRTWGELQSVQVKTAA